MEESIKAIENAAKLASEKGLIRFTRFLDPAQAVLSARVAASNRVRFSAFGGYDGAERVIGCFYPCDTEVYTADYPLVCLHSRYSSRFCSISHRDLLGSFMALGLTRSCIGDIIISEPDIYLFVDEKTAEYVSASLTSAGRCSLNFKVLTEIPVIPEPEGTAFSCTVNSLRLDAVLAGAYHFSRSESQETIRAGLVKVDHILCDQVDMQLKENALLSVRGKGRVRLISIGGLTRKQRIGIHLFRYD